jgi:surface polysaccharide O-acyltransferase-like enzyme
MIHASGLGSFASCFYNGIARFSVPVFVIISGYYMLARRPDGRRLTKKILRLFLLMLVWSAVYYCYGLLCGDDWTGSLITYLLTQPVHLWYLYAAIALYLFTPLLYVFCAHATRQEEAYALGLTFFLGSIITMLLRADCFPVLSEIIDKTKAPYTLGFLFLYLLGDYLRRYELRRRVRDLLYAAGLLGAIIAVLGAWKLPDYGLSRDLVMSFFAPNVMATGAAIFVFVRQIYAAHPIRSDQTKRRVHHLADCTLGIYLLHPLVMRVLQQTVERVWHLENLWFLIPMRTLLTFVLSAAVIFCVKKIPVLNRLA